MEGKQDRRRQEAQSTAAGTSQLCKLRDGPQVRHDQTPLRAWRGHLSQWGSWCPMGTPPLLRAFPVSLQPQGPPLHERVSSLLKLLLLPLSAWHFFPQIPEQFLPRFLQVSAQIPLCQKALRRHPIKRITITISFPLTCCTPLPDISSCLLSPPSDVTEETLFRSRLYPLYHHSAWHMLKGQ